MVDLKDGHFACRSTILRSSTDVVANAHSRRQYEENDTTQVCEVKMDSDENMKENPELAMVTLYYKQEHVYEVSALNAEQLQTTVDDSDTLKIAR